MKTTPSTMSPVEAYEALMLFAQRRGEGALRLAMHAAVPQSFRPDLLHLLKLNFLPRELHDPAAEADVLFSPLCEEVGRGYFEFGPHVRTLLLDNLAANYASDRTPRIARVANFLLHYVEQLERRAAGGLDHLLRDYLEVQRWVALAFLDPDDAARQLAAALKGTSEAGGEFAARLRLGGLATALSSPLIKYRHVLNYAAGLQALEAGDHERARRLLSGLGDEEIEVGGIRLRPAAELLRDYAAPPTPEPTGPTQEETTPVAEEDDEPHVPVHLSLFCVYHDADSERVVPLLNHLTQHELHVTVESIGHQPDDITRDVQHVLRTQAGLEERGGQVDAYLFFQTQHFRHLELTDLITSLVSSATQPIVIARLDPEARQLSELGRTVSYVNLLDAKAGFDRLIYILQRVEQEKERERERKQMEAEAEGASEPPPYEELLATLREDESEERRVEAAVKIGELENPSLLQHLAAALRDESARVRREAVRGLARVPTDHFLPDLLEATRDPDELVQEAASQALRSFGETMVMLMGRFTPERKHMLDLVRKELQRRGYFPVMFDFDKPPSLTLTEVSVTLAQHSRFLIADLTDPTNVPYELQAIVPQNRVPLLPIIQEQSRPFSFFEDIQRYPWVLPLVTYHSAEDLLANFSERLIAPAEEKLRELKEEPTRNSKEQPGGSRKRLFISCSHKDEKWLEMLTKMLVPLVPRELISVWVDPNIKAGRSDEFRHALVSAKVVVLLVSPDFLASDFVAMNEVMSLLEASEREGMRLVWVAVGASLFKETNLSRYQAVNDPEMPLASLPPPERDRVLAEVCRRIGQFMSK